MSKKNIPATTGSTALTTSYEADAGAGFEEMNQEHFSIPFLNILQKMSPSCDEDSPTYVPGAKAGKLVNSVTQTLYEGKDGVKFIPVHSTHNFVEWRPREQGGGVMAIHEPESAVVRHARQQAGGNWAKLKVGDHDLVETFAVYGLLLNDDESFESVVVNFASSNIRAYKRWMTTARSIQIRTEDGRRINPPLFSHVYRVRTQFQENNKGSWYSYNVTLATPTAAECRLHPESELYMAAKSFRSLVTSGVASASYDEPKADEAEEGEDTF
jgi:hypothetical protein